MRLVEMRTAAATCLAGRRLFGPLRRRPRPQARRGGFTILEAAIVSVIVGVGAVALIELLAAGTATNAYAAEQTTAMHLVGNIREISLGLKFEDPDAPKEWDTAEAAVAEYDDIKDLDGKTFSPPLNGRRQPNPTYANWAQVLSVHTVAPDHLKSVRPKDPTEPTARITVRILRQGREVYRRSWITHAPNAAWDAY